MPRTLNGSTDSITLSLGAMGFALGPGTVAAIVKRSADGSSDVIVQFGATAAVGWGLRISSTDVLNVNIDGTSRNAVSLDTCTAADGWLLVAATKATGTVNPRMHRYEYATGVWQHANTGTANANSSTPVTSNFIGIADAGGGGFAGDEGVLAGWNVVLTDAQIEALAYSAMAWFAVQPKGMWLLDQATTGQKVLDITGGGANESAISGTSVSTSSMPVFSRGAEVLYVNAATIARVVAEGDSITSGYLIANLNAYARQANLLFTTPPQLFNVALAAKEALSPASGNFGGGSALDATSINNRDRLYIAGSSIFSILIGTVDLLDGQTAAQAYVSIKNVWSGARAAGYKVIAHSVPYMNSGIITTATPVDDLNTLIESDASLYDDYVDANAAYTFAQVGASTIDGLHPTEAMHTIIASWEKAAQERVFATLIVAAAAIAFSIEAPVLVQQNTLAVANSTFALAIEAPDLVAQQNTLSVDDETIASSAESVDLAQQNTLAVADETIAFSIEAPSLTQQNVIAADDSTTALAIENPALVQANVLGVDDSAVATSAESIDLAQQNTLATDDSAISLGADNVTLSTAGSLAVADSALATSVEAVDLVQQNALSVDDADVASTADDLLLVQQAILQADNANIASTVDAVSLIQALLADDVGVALSAEGVQLTVQHLLSVDGAAVAFSIDSPTLILPSVDYDALRATLTMGPRLDFTVSMVPRLDYQTEMGPRLTATLTILPG